MSTRKQSKPRKQNNIQHTDTTYAEHMRTYHYCELCIGDNAYHNAVCVCMINGKPTSLCQGCYAKQAE